jgi:glutamate:GABA antiporter
MVAWLYWINNAYWIPSVYLIFAGTFEEIFLERRSTWQEALLVGNALLSDSQSNVFWMTFKLSGLCLLLCYLMVFPAFLILRRKRADQPRPYRLPGGPAAAAAAAWVCTFYIACACVLFFAPSPTSQEPVREALILGAETIATIVAGLLLIPRVSRSAASV